MDSKNTSSENMLQSGNSTNLDGQPKRKKAHAGNRRCPSRKTVIVCCIVCLIFLGITVVVLAVLLNRSRSDCPAPSGSACHPQWVGYQGKCNFFSREERNWSASQSFCLSQQASLARIESEEKDFFNFFKLTHTYWIGLRREPGQPWKWPNGEKATLPVLGDGGDCAYLNDEAKASTSRCSTEHHWMCSKADALQTPT